MRIPTPITLLGYTGQPDTQGDARQFYARIRDEVQQQLPANTTLTDDEWARRAAPILEKHVTATGIAGYHNRLVPLATTYITATRTANQATTDTETAYAELSNRHVASWHAAHHRYVLAVDAARRALLAQLAAARTLTEEASAYPGTPREYDKYVPADNRITIPDVGALNLTLTQFITTNTERFALLAATTAGAYPPGFTPDNDQHTDTATTATTAPTESW